jgi:hypothetical protein
MTVDHISATILTVDRADVDVLYLEVGDEQPQIQQGWQRIEEILGDLHGRHFMASVDLPAHRYRVCVQQRDGDDPSALGLDEGVVAGGRYLRARLQGEPPNVYEFIAPTCDLLAGRVDWDTSRPLIEHYRRRDEIDVCIPVGPQVTINREVVDVTKPD